MQATFEFVDVRFQLCNVACKCVSFVHVEFEFMLYHRILYLRLGDSQVSL